MTTKQSKYTTQALSLGNALPEYQRKLVWGHELADRAIRENPGREVEAVEGVLADLRRGSYELGSADPVIVDTVAFRLEALRGY